jgi:hypothetical protein
MFAPWSPVGPMPLIERPFRRFENNRISPRLSSFRQDEGIGLVFEVLQKTE